MVKLYFKQAWQLLKQNKLFSTIYIIGTGLAISMVMLLIIIYYIKVANIYPETNRERMMVMKYGVENSIDKNRGTASHYFSYQAVKDFFYTLETPEAVTAIYYGDSEDSYVERPDRSLIPVQLKYTDAAFWQVFSFSFLAGKPYSQAEFDSGIHTVVISESLAGKVFNTTDVVGKTLSLNFTDYRVSGVVRDASYATPVSYAQIWLPYSCNSSYEEKSGITGMLGGMQVYILMNSSSEADVVSKEINDRFHRFNAFQTERIIALNGQPNSFHKSVFHFNSMDESNWLDFLRISTLFLLLSLLVPAINLSGMISSRMERRTAEIGVRKAFGASNKVVLTQILYENLLLTFLGGIIGLILSYLLVLFSRNWFLDLFNLWSEPLPEGVEVLLTPSMLINPTIFLVVFGVCLFLNVLTGILPAWNSCRRNIVDSLNIKD